MKITNISLGFKKNETVHCCLSGAEYPSFKSIKIKDNTNTKVIVHCTEAEKKTVSESTIREFVGDSKIVYDIKKSTNIRSSKIIEVKSIKDKFLEYLKVNDIECSDGLLEKLKMIEDELEIDSAIRSRSFTLLKMSLRGAIGIHEGTGKDEIEFDFTKFSDGLIALVGKNGGGKSTSIENCHPYPKLISRTSKLQDHFYLKDSFRKLLYVDDEGVYYSIEILIDGKTKNGKVKYLVSTGSDINSLNPVPECDGNSDTYEKWVNDTFGPLELFLRTCFFAKEATKGIPDISEATKGQKKDLFISLIGIDNLTQVNVAAKKMLSGLKTKAESLKNRFEDIDYDSIEKNYNEEISKNRSLLENLTEQKKVMRAIIREAEAKKVEYEATIPDTTTLQHMKDMWSKQMSQKVIIDNYELNKDDYEEVKGVFSEVEELKSKTFELEGQYMSQDLKHSKLKAQMDELKVSAKNMASNISAFKSSHLLSLTKSMCPTCGQPIESHKEEELKAEIKANKAELVKLEKELEKTKGKAEHLKPAIELGEEELKKAKEALNEMKRSLAEKTAQTRGFDIKAINQKEAEYTFVKSQFDEEKFNKLKDDIKKLEEAIEERTSSARTAINGLNTIIVENEDKLTHIEFDINSIVSSISSYETKLDMLNTDRDTQSKIRAEYEEVVTELSQYELIADAFDKNGIQALELEAMAPEIAGITNSILESAYGDRFRISFETLREGSNHNLIEDFSILVEDTSTGTVRPLEWLSSGEAVWIKEALYNAFTIERERTTGFTFRTRFLDESDGSLDSSARMKYLSMIESAHEEGNVNHTVIITHSQELKDLIPQQMDITAI